MDKKLRYFLFFTFLISWLGWGSLLGLTRAGLLEFGQPLFMIPFILAGFGPTIAPFIAIAMTEGKAGLKNYFYRLFKFKVWCITYLWVTYVAIYKQAYGWLPLIPQLSVLV